MFKRLEKGFVFKHTHTHTETFNVGKQLNMNKINL